MKCAGFSNSSLEVGFLFLKIVRNDDLRIEKGIQREPEFASEIHSGRAYDKERHFYQEFAEEEGKPIKYR